MIAIIRTFNWVIVVINSRKLPIMMISSAGTKWLVDSKENMMRDPPMKCRHHTIPSLAHFFNQAYCNKLGAICGLLCIISCAHFCGDRFKRWEAVISNTNTNIIHIF